MKNRFFPLGEAGRLVATFGILASTCVCGFAGEDIHWETNNAGLTSLTFKNHEFLVHPSDGLVKVFARTPLFDGIQDPKGWRPTIPVEGGGDTVLVTYDWGTIEAKYSGTGNKLDIRVKIQNSDTRFMSAIKVQVARLNYSAVAKVSVDDKEPVEFKGGVPMVNIAECRPVIVSFPEGSMEVSAEADGKVDGSVGLAFAESQGRVNRIAIHIKDIPAGESREVLLKLAFAVRVVE